MNIQQAVKTVINKSAILHQAINSEQTRTCQFIKFV
uniref:Uncharacterized protein n=1 Tax=Anguilla anguilla TaxID=7936 RepID=A0A0E9XNY2_ANGAN